MLPSRHGRISLKLSLASKLLERPVTVEMTYAEAACAALKLEMESDPRVWALGEDLGAEGGSAGQYRGLQALFGKNRIVDTPISENMIMAAAIGAAISGTRPVVELRFADFAMCAADEIVNQAAKIRYMFNDQTRVPLVVRNAMGLRNGVAAQHSQSFEAWWVHVPGLVVVAPSTPADNFGLLRAAIQCDDPVVYLEHKGLWQVKGRVDVKAPPSEFGRATFIHEGRDITIVTWSAMRATCLEAASELESQGISAEVIDLRTLWPWDRGAVQESVRKTGRLLVVHEAVRAGGFGGEVVAEISEALWPSLRCAPRRLGAPRIPVPYAKPLEDVFAIPPYQISSIATSMVRDK
jgi:pyruvate/2-oxoglutarate/acetoin dehydrogenase E1 component